jgi:hypothetical protein
MVRWTSGALGSTEDCGRHGHWVWRRLAGVRCVNVFNANEDGEVKGRVKEGVLMAGRVKA